ncbi:MAG: glucosaminidase domain-containing protein [Paraclostridium sp.]
MTFNKNKIIKYTIMTLTGVVYSIGLLAYGDAKLDIYKERHDQELVELTNAIEDNKIYKELFDENNQIIKDLKVQNGELSDKLNFINEQIVVSKELDDKYNSSLGNKKLTEYPILTIDEMNNWISNRAPENSTFIGKGEEFLEVAKDTDLDPRYLVAHAALESAWGTSKIAKDKNNYYGIGAFNKSPYESAYTFSSAEEGIREGAEWIKRNYTDQGYDTLNKMLYNDEGKVYCTLNDSKTPDITWMQKIVAIMK